MNTTQHLLPAINGLYELGLSDKDMEDINSKVSDLERGMTAAVGNKYYKDSAVDILNVLEYEVRKSSVIVSSGCGSQVNIQKINDKEFEDGGHYQHWGDKKNLFKLKITYRDNLYIENIQETDFESMYVLSRILDDIEVPGVSNKVHKNVKDVVSTCEDYLMDNWSSIRMNIDKKDIELVLKEVFKGGKESTICLDKKNKRLLYDNRKLSFITNVLEKDNFRLFVSQQREHSRWSTDTSVSLKVIPHSDPSYNYVDVGRYYFCSDSVRRGYYQRYENHVPVGNLIFTDLDPALPNIKILDNYLRGRDDNHVEFLDNNSLNLITKRDLQRTAREQAAIKSQEKLREKIKDRLNTLLIPGKSLKLNGVLYSEDKIEYENQVLKSDISGLPYKVLSTLSKAYNLDDINFDQALPIFLSYVSNTEGSGSVGEVSFKVEKRVSTNSIGISTTRMYVNDKRINSDEVEPVIERGLCFTKQDDFDYFIKSVSKCSLKMHTYLQIGVDINVRHEFNFTNVSLKLPLERRKNINYIVINDTSYRVKNTQKIIRLSRQGSMLDVVNTLLDGKSVEGVEVDDIKGIISSGKKAFIDAIEKSKELLVETEKTFGIEEETVIMSDGESKTGYLIKGSLRNYFIDTGGKEQINTNDPQCGVYSFPDGKYICIVDKSSSQVGMDKLVNRIYALHNDALVASAIHTL